MIKKILKTWAHQKLQKILNEQKALQNEIADGALVYGSTGYEFALLRMSVLDVQGSVILAIIDKG